MKAPGNAEEVLQQRDWTDAALRAAGFRFCRPRKRLVMARELGTARTIRTVDGPLQALPGDMLCFRPDGESRAHPDEHEHWPVRRELFGQNYRPWDERLPDLPDLPLFFQSGCAAWYKHRGVWAQRLLARRRIQSLESAQPVTVGAGQWLLIGSAGEPWHMDDEAFRSRYFLPAGSGDAD